MAIEKILKATAVLGTALGVALSAYGSEKSSDFKECMVSLKDTNMKIVETSDNGKNVFLTTQDSKGKKYILKLVDKYDTPSWVLFRGFSPGADVKFSLQDCLSEKGDTYLIDRFRKVGNIMYGKDFPISGLKLE